MPTRNCRKFKGEIENYLRNQQNILDSKMDSAFSSLKVKTWLSKTNIIKKDGWHASHLLFVLIMLPLWKINTIHSFCGKMWSHWSESGKDAFYRFKQKAFRWRTFMYKLNMEMFEGVELEKCPRKEQYFLVCSFSKLFDQVKCLKFKVPKVKGTKMTITCFGCERKTSSGILE